MRRLMTDLPYAAPGLTGEPEPTRESSVSRRRSLILQRHFVIVRVMTVDVMRPPPDDPKVCSQQKTVRWPLASA
jgi:hypothetical protein